MFQQNTILLTTYLYINFKQVVVAVAGAGKKVTTCANWQALQLGFAPVMCHKIKSRRPTLAVWARPPDPVFSGMVEGGWDENEAIPMII